MHSAPSLTISPVSFLPFCLSPPCFSSFILLFLKTFMGISFLSLVFDIWCSILLLYMVALNIWCTVKTKWNISSHKCLKRTQHLTFVDPCIIVQFIKKYPTRCNNVSNFIIPYLYEAQHVSNDTPPIIRSLKLHWQPLVFHTWKVVCTYNWWTLSGTLCLTKSTKYTYTQPSTYEKPEAASAVLGSWWWAVCRSKHVELHINME